LESPARTICQSRRSSIEVKSGMSMGRSRVVGVKRSIGLKRPVRSFVLTIEKFR
jgi:hypothetical protein